MLVPFLLFLIAILLLLIFWELSKINSRLKKASRPVSAVSPEGQVVKEVLRT